MDLTDAVAAITEELAQRLGPAALIVGAAAAVGLVLEVLIRRMLLWRAGDEATHLRSVLASSLRGLPTLLAILAGARIAVAYLDLSVGVTNTLLRYIMIIAVGGITLVSARAAGAAVRVVMSRDDVALPSSTIFVILVRTFVLIVGGLTVMALAGIPIGPFIAGLGVGGIALGLALQDPLSNVFSGVQVLLSGEVRAGDFIRLESGEEGWVHDVTWRNMTLQLRSNDLVLVPNSVFANSMVMNFTRMDAEHIAWVDVGVSYDSDLGHVEDVTCDVALEVQREIPGAVRSWEPILRYTSFGDSAILFRVALRASTYVEHRRLISEFVKRLHRRYAHEGIRIPYPQRDVHVQTPGPTQGAVGGEPLG